MRRFLMLIVVAFAAMSPGCGATNDPPPANHSQPVHAQTDVTHYPNFTPP